MTEDATIQLEIEITEKMIEAAARVLFDDVSLDVSPSWGLILAERMIRCALQASRGGTLTIGV